MEAKFKTNGDKLMIKILKVKRLNWVNGKGGTTITSKMEMSHTKD